MSTHINLFRIAQLNLKKCSSFLFINFLFLFHTVYIYIYISCNRGTQTWLNCHYRFISVYFSYIYIYIYIYIYSSWLDFANKDLCLHWLHACWWLTRLTQDRHVWLTFRQAYSPSLKTATAQKTLLKHWDQLKSAILQTSEDVLGFTTEKNKDWFDVNNQEIQELLAKKRSSHQAHLAQPSCPVRRTAFHLICSIRQCMLRVIQNEW